MTWGRATHERRAPVGEVALCRTATIRNSLGMHARAAGKFAKAAGGFKAEVAVSKDGQTVSGLSIMGLMMLAAGPGSEITITVSGPEAKAALDSLVALVERAFEQG
jgi:phosphocarrier protein